MRPKPLPPLTWISRKVFDENWPIRRRTMFGALFFIALWISYILWDGKDTALNQQAILALTGAGVVIITSYVFGANADDKDKREKLMEIGALDRLIPPRQPRTAYPLRPDPGMEE